MNHGTSGALAFIFMGITGVLTLYGQARKNIDAHLQVKNNDELKGMWYRSTRHEQ